ncbi:hypothetical protein [Micromonospora aurantiaca (nom. illeg.)]|uniref:hypothetical protein n=1 Tax=Micromonospora aurantiaca (nom. illeg.) TaxID=47850 RepID=UPI0008290413|nr:hypothetical protein [Micromonospora aurantiaca]SCL43372.1 hypothetical protein GA0070615_6425 [Micromonospora aurantiaca]
MALIYPKDRADAQVLAKGLLEAAGEERRFEVRTTTDGPVGLAFDVPDDLAEKVLSSGDGRQRVEAPAEAEATAQGTSADAGADGSGADAEPADGSSQPPAKASRSSRGSRS